MSSNAQPKPAPGTPEWDELVVTLRNLQPEPLPDMNGALPFRHASNLASIGVHSTGSDHSSQYGDESEEEDAGDSEAQEPVAVTHDQGNVAVQPVAQPQQDVSQQDALQQAPQVQIAVLPPSDSKTISWRRNGPRGTPAPPPDARPALDRGPLNDRTIAVDTFIFDGTIADIRSLTPPPWRFLGTPVIALRNVKRPIDFPNLAIRALGGQATVRAHLTRTPTDNEEKDGEIKGSAIFWMDFQERRGDSEIGWHFAGVESLRAFLEDWMRRHVAGVMDGLEVRILLWHHDEASKAREARKVKIPGRPADGNVGVAA